MSKQQYAKAKGRTWEQEVCDWLRLNGIPAERRRLTGAQDCGDVAGFPHTVIEAKSCKAIDLAGWSDELAAEVGNAEARYGKGHVGLILAKRRGKRDVQDGYAIMPPDLALTALQALLRERSAG